MFKNYFKIAWRSLLKQRLYAAINIGGLALGITCFLTIFLYVQHELSYDQFHDESEQVYKVYQQQKGNMFMGTDLFSVVPCGLSIAMRAEIPEVAQTTLVAERRQLIGSASYGFYERGLYADPYFFELFSFRFAEGTPATALNSANQIVLTQRFADKLFEGENPMGKEVLLNNDQTLIVTGVLEDIPLHSTLQFEYIISFSTDKQFDEGVAAQDWGNSAYNLFCKVHKESSSQRLQEKLSQLAEKYVNQNEDLGRYWEVSYIAKPLSEYHLFTEANFDVGLKGNPTYVRLFGWVAIIILLLACINYMNLEIARSVKRAKEVGMRKVIGAKRRQIIVQFMGESVLVASLAMLVALSLTQLSLPVFGQLLDRTLSLNLWDHSYLLALMIGLAVVVGILSGSYPSIVISSVQPLRTLKSAEKPRAKLGLQRVLVVVQYTTAIFLAISSVVIFHQFQFIQQKELGYQKEHIINISVDREFPLKTTKETWLQRSEILQVTASVDLPSEVTSSSTIQKDSTSEEELNIYQTRADSDYFTTYNITLLEGRMFHDDEKGVCILNETAVKAFGTTPKEIIGQSVYMREPLTVVGVVKDYHTHSFHLAIQPLIIQPISWFARYLSVKVQPSNLPETLQFLEKSVRAQSPYPFEYSFFEEEFDRMYKTEIRYGKMLNWFTGIALAIASLGLFGLAAFAAVQRTKEIGIRKVLGASTHSIVALLAKDFVLLVMLGFAIAVPLAWYFANEWLQNFVYRIELAWWVFGMAGGAALVIAVLTVSVQSLKAAWANPVYSLRNE